MHSLGVSRTAEDGVSSQEESFDGTTVMLGGNLAEKNEIRPIELPEVQKHPPYTTWTFLYRSVHNHMHFSTSPNLCCVQKSLFSILS